jgi:hypothetical protein
MVKSAWIALSRRSSQTNESQEIPRHLVSIFVPLHDNLGEIYRDSLEEVGRQYQDSPGVG